jgi:hypothetical protein
MPFLLAAAAVLVIMAGARSGWKTSAMQADEATPKPKEPTR